MADVERQGTRGQGHHPEWEFPYAHCLMRLPDGSCVLANSKIPQNGLIFSHGTSGAYVEVNNSGDITTYTVGNKNDYNKSGVTVTVLHNGDIVFQGHQRIMIGGNGGGAHIEVAGDAGITVGGNTALVGMGRVNVRAKNMYLAADQDIAMHASGNMDIKVDKNLSMTVDGKTTMITNDVHRVTASPLTINPGNR